MSSRCDAFRDSGNNVGFIHPFKAGGTSFRMTLNAQAAKAHKKLAPEHGALASMCTGKTLTECRKQLAPCEVLEMPTYAFASEALYWNNGTTLWLTMLREPSARLESMFRYHGGKGAEYVKTVKARNGSLQEEFERMLTQPEDLHVPFLLAPPSLWIDAYGADEPWLTRTPSNATTNSTGGNMHVRPKMHLAATRSATLSEAQFARLADFIASRFAVTGVLERISDTLEVMRCRVPWFRTKVLPKVEETAQHWQYPVRLERRDALIQAHAATELRLYALANQLLDADLECCRRSRGTRANHTNHT